MFILMLKVVALVAVLSGCSLTLQSKPKAGQMRAQSGCSTSSGFWVADMVLSAASAGALVYLASRRGEPEGVAAGPAALSAIVFYASGDNGRRWRNQCAADAAPVTARADANQVDAAPTLARSSD